MLQPEIWRPRRRLRHLRGVCVRHLHSAQHQPLAFFELLLPHGDTEHLLYRSELVSTSTSVLKWSCIDFSIDPPANLPKDIIHSPNVFSIRLKVILLSQATPDPPSDPHQPPPHSTHPHPQHPSCSPFTHPPYHCSTCATLARIAGLNPVPPSLDAPPLPAPSHPPLPPSHHASLPPPTMHPAAATPPQSPSLPHEPPHSSPHSPPLPPLIPSSSPSSVPHPATSPQPAPTPTPLPASSDPQPTPPRSLPAHPSTRAPPHSAPAPSTNPAPLCVSIQPTDDGDDPAVRLHISCSSTSTSGSGLAPSASQSRSDTHGVLLVQILPSETDPESVQLLIACVGSTSRSGSSSSSSSSSNIGHAGNGSSSGSSTAERVAPEQHSSTASAREPERAAAVHLAAEGVAAGQGGEEDGTRRLAGKGGEGVAVRAEGGGVCGVEGWQEEVVVDRWLELQELVYVGDSEDVVVPGEEVVTNLCLLQLEDGIYVPEGWPGAVGRAPGEAPELQRLDSLHASSSGPLLASQQQVFRWMMSSGSIVQPLAAGGTPEDGPPLPDSGFRAIIGRIFGQNPNPPANPSPTPPLRAPSPSPNPQPTRQGGHSRRPSSAASIGTPDDHPLGGGAANQGEQGPSERARPNLTKTSGTPSNPPSRAPSPKPADLVPGGAGAGSSVAGGDLAGGMAGSLERTYDVLEFRAEIRRMVAAQERLNDAEARRDRIRSRVTDLLAATAATRSHTSSLRTTRDSAAALRAAAAAGKARLAAKRREAAAVEARAAERVGRLLGAVESLLSEQAKLVDRRRRLLGDEGRGFWKTVHSDLVARRNRLVAQLAGVYEIGPATSSPLDRSPLEECIDRTWWSGSEVATFSATPSLQQLLDGRGRADAPGGGPEEGSARLVIAGLEVRGDLAKRGIEGSMGWTGEYDEEQRVAASLGYVAYVVSRLAHYLNVPLRYPIRAASSVSVIMDPCPPTAPRTAPLALPPPSGSGSANSSRGNSPTRSRGQQRGPSDGERGGQKRQRVNEGALDALDWGGPAPPPAPAGSSTGVTRASQPPGRAGRLGAVLQRARKGGRASHTGTPGVQVAEFPLYYEGWDRTRFAYGVFLLNKDIEQLLAAHALPSSGPNALLQNLFTLVSAATSALPPPPPPRPLPLPAPQPHGAGQEGEGVKGVAGRDVGVLKALLGRAGSLGRRGSGWVAGQ